MNTSRAGSLVILIALLALAPLGCAGDAERTDRERQQELERAFLAGHYHRSLAELETNLADDACRRRDASAMKAVVDSLFAHHDMIIHHLNATSQPPDLLAGTRAFGLSLLEEDLPADHPPPGPAGARERLPAYSWARASELLATATRTANAEDWCALWRHTIGLIERERWRGHQSVRLMRRDEHATLEGLTSRVRACDIDPGCTRLARLGAAERAFIEARRDLAAHLLLLDKSPARATARDHIHQLYMGLDRMLSFHSDRPTSAVSTRGRALVINVDPGPYAAVCEEVGAIVDAFWSTSDMPVEVACSPSDLDFAGAFRLTFAPESASSFVDRSSRVVGFTYILQPRVIAHEFGHVMGLMDRYFHSFDEKRCTHFTEVDHSDLMSGHGSGAATQSARDFLRATYFQE